WGLRRPDRTLVHRAVRPFDKMIARKAAVIRRVTFLFFRVRINDADNAEALAAQVRNHFFRIGKPLMIPGEWFVAVLVVNIEPDHVGRHFLLTKCVRQQPDARFGIIAPTALIVAERPKGRERHPARQRGVTLDYLFGIRAVDEVVVQVPPSAPKVSKSWRSRPTSNVLRQVLSRKIPWACP